MLVVAAMVTATRLGAGAGVRVRPAEGRRPSQGPHHLGGGHDDRRGQREVDGDVHLAAEVAAAAGGAAGADADALAVRRAVGHVGALGERCPRGGVEQRRHGGAQQRHEHRGLLALALLPHGEEDGYGLQERRHGAGDDQVDEGREVAVGHGARARAVGRVDGALARRGHERRRRHRQPHAQDAAGDAHRRRALGVLLLLVVHGWCQPMNTPAG
jgi:hypothetical protein